MNNMLLSCESLVNVFFSSYILGVLFYYAPDSERAHPIVVTLRERKKLFCWPYVSEDQRENFVSFFTQVTEESLEDAYQRLFIGSHALVAPPWGSVYLDKDKILFGESTIALRNWMVKKNIVCHICDNEPEDHVGKLFFLNAYLAEKQPCLLPDFLESHLFSWIFRYLDLLIKNAQHPFYHGVAKLTELTLKSWQNQLSFS